MKKTTIAALALAGLALAGGAGLYAGRQLTRSRAIGEENAKIFACADAGLPAGDTDLRRCALGREAGRAVYSLELEGGGALWTYTVDALDGRVLHRSFETLPQAPGVPAEQLAAAVRNYVNTLPTRMNEADARARLKVYLNGQNVRTIRSRGYPYSNRSDEYHFTVTFSDDSVGYYVVDALHGTVTPAANEVKSAPVPGFTPGGPVSEEEAQAIALAQFGLQQEDVTVGLDLFMGDEGPFYLVEALRPGRIWYECQIDAATGYVLTTASHPWDDFGRFRLFLARRTQENRQKAAALVRRALSDGGPLTQEEAQRVALAYERIPAAYADFTGTEFDGASYRLTCQTDGWVTWTWRIDAATGQRLESSREIDLAGVRQMVLEHEGIEKHYGMTCSLGYDQAGSTWQGPYWTVTVDMGGWETREYKVDPCTGRIRDAQTRKDAAALAAEAASYVRKLAQSKSYAVRAAMERAGISARDKPVCYIAEFDGKYEIDLFVKDRFWYQSRSEVTGGKVLSEETTDWSEVTGADMLSCSERALFFECASAARRARTRMTQGIGQAGILMMAQAKALALAENLLTEDQVSFSRVQYATEDTLPVYQVTYRVGNAEYDYRVDARTGVVTGGGQTRPKGNALDRLLYNEMIEEADLLCWTADVFGTDWSYTLTLQFLDGTRRVFRVDLGTGEITEKP